MVDSVLVLDDLTLLQHAHVSDGARIVWQLEALQDHAIVPTIVLAGTRLLFLTLQRGALLLLLISAGCRR